MLRWTMTPLVVLVLLPTAWASRDAGKLARVDRPLRSGRALATSSTPVSAAPGADEFVLTTMSEVLVDGQPCPYRDVPKQARIVHLEVAADGKTILKVHFRTGK